MLYFIEPNTGLTKVTN